MAPLRSTPAVSACSGGMPAATEPSAAGKIVAVDKGSQNDEGRTLAKVADSGVESPESLSNNAVGTWTTFVSRKAWTMALSIRA